MMMHLAIGRNTARSFSFGLALALCLSAASSAEEPLPVIDLHVDLPYRSFYKGSSFDMGSGQYRAARLFEAGVRGVVLPLFVPKDAKPDGRTAEQFERSYALLFRELSAVAPYSLPGCEDPASSNPRAVRTYLSFEDSGPVEPTDAAISGWILRGIRVFGIVHTEANSLATSSGQPTRGLGLTERGRLFTKLVWKHGGIVDVSHASDEATNELIALAREYAAHGRLIATHSNARALAPHPRNLTDEQIRAISELGGVIGVNFHGRFLDAETGRGTLAQVVQQFRYLRSLGGAEVLAIGSDFEGGISPPPELASELGFLRLRRALLAGGFEAREVRAAFSENAARVLCPRP